jgi:hypothetical protein
MIARRESRVWGLIVTVCALFLGTGRCTGDEWRYSVVPAGDAHEHPPLRAIALQSERPEDLKETVTYRGTQRRYAQIRYGSPGSIRVAVVLDHVSPSEVDLYVDANRNRVIEDNDRIDGQDRTWRLPLDVAIVEGDKTRFEQRNGIFRLGATGRTLSYAAAGYLEGKVTIGEREVAVWRQDGDGNGFFTDAQDRLWFDLNGDDRWDAASEQYLFSTILAIGDTRYVVRSDEVGSKLAMEKLEGTGKVQVALLGREADAGPVLELTATLVGRDGTAVGLRGAEAEATVPVGEYRISTLTLSVADPGGGLPWSYVFSDNGGRPDQKWYKIERDGSVVIDPIGKIELLTGVGENATCRVGESLSVQPRLYSGDGLLINTCYRGLQQSLGYGGPSARIALATTDGTPIGETQSGFA